MSEAKWSKRLGSVSIWSKYPQPEWFSSKTDDSKSSGPTDGPSTSKTEDER